MSLDSRFSLWNPKMRKKNNFKKTKKGTCSLLRAIWSVSRPFNNIHRKNESKKTHFLLSVLNGPSLMFRFDNLKFIVIYRFLFFQIASRKISPFSFLSSFSPNNDRTKFSIPVEPCETPPWLSTTYVFFKMASQKNRFLWRKEQIITVDKNHLITSSEWRWLRKKKKINTFSICKKKKSMGLEPTANETAKQSSCSKLKLQIFQQEMFWIERTRRNLWEGRAGSIKKRKLRGLISRRNLRQKGRWHERTRNPVTPFFCCFSITCRMRK